MAPFGLAGFSSAGAGGGAGSSFFFGSTMPSLPTIGPPWSSVAGGGVLGCCACGLPAAGACAQALPPQLISPTSNHPAQTVRLVMTTTPERPQESLPD